MTHPQYFFIGVGVGTLVTVACTIAFSARTLKFYRKLYYRLGSADTEEAYEKHLVRALDYNSELKREVARLDHALTESREKLAACRRQHVKDVVTLNEAYNAQGRAQMDSSVESQ